MMDSDYYVLTLAAIARELNISKIYSADVIIAAGLPLTWVSEQKEDFKKYLLQHDSVDYTFKGKVTTKHEYKPMGIFSSAFLRVNFRKEGKRSNLGCIFKVTKI